MKTFWNRAGALLLALCFSLSLCAPARAADAPVASGSCGANLQYELYGNGDGTYKLVITGSGGMFAYNTVTVRPPWYDYRNHITEAELPAGLTTIGDYAFQDCTSLALTELPAGLTSIGDAAFSGCTNLALTELPEGVTYIGVRAFDRCTSLINLTIPDGVTSIEQFAFYGCTSLINLTIPDGVTSIGEGAFYNCSNLTLTELPAGLTYIGAKAFRNCTSLALTELPAGLTAIRSYAFDGCTSLALTELPAAVAFLDSNAFYNATWRITTEHYLQTISGDQYSLAERTTSLAKSNTSARAEQIAPVGFHPKGRPGGRDIGAYIPAGGAIVFKVYYDRDIYTVSFQTNGAPAVEDQTVRYGATAQEPEQPLRQGYRFLGWFTDEALTAPYDFAAPVTGDRTLWAKWAERGDTPYQVLHYLEELSGGYVLADTVELTGTTGAVADASVRAYTGFHENTSHADRLASGTVAPDGSLTLRLYYDRDIHTVSFQTNGAPAVEGQAVRHGATAQEPEQPLRQGYRFLGWFTDEALTAPHNFSDPVTGDLTLWARWASQATSGDAQTYTITVQADTGCEVDPAGTVRVYAGNSKTFSIRALDGYTLADVLLDGESVLDRLENGKLTLKKVGRSHTLKISTSPLPVWDPNAPLTRAQAAVVFCEVLSEEVEEVQAAGSHFPDIPPGVWYESAVATLSGAGIVTGCSDGTYQPERQITRGEFAALCARFDGCDEYSGEDLFDDIALHWSRDLVNRAAAGNWFQSVGGSFRPDSPVTRGEALDLLRRHFSPEGLPPDAGDSQGAGATRSKQ